MNLKIDKIDKETRKQIVKKYVDDKLSLKQVGDFFNVSAYLVKTVLLSEGKEVRTSAETCKINIKPIPEDWLDMARLQKQGLSYEKIANSHYCSVTCVKTRLRKIRERGIKV